MCCTTHSTVNECVRSTICCVDLIDLKCERYSYFQVITIVYNTHRVPYPFKESVPSFSLSLSSYTTVTCFLSLNPLFLLPGENFLARLMKLVCFIEIQVNHLLLRDLSARSTLARICMNAAVALCNLHKHERLGPYDQCSLFTSIANSKELDA